jgi:hypothetical protein
LIALFNGAFKGVAAPQDGRRIIDSTLLKEASNNGTSSLDLGARGQADPNLRHHLNLEARSLAVRPKARNRPLASRPKPEVPPLDETTHGAVLGKLRPQVIDEHLGGRCQECTIGLKCKDLIGPKHPQCRPPCFKGLEQLHRPIGPQEKPGKRIERHDRDNPRRTTFVCQCPCTGHERSVALMPPVEVADGDYVHGVAPRPSAPIEVAFGPKRRTIG